ncbi:glycosyltransferase [Nocardioides sp. C4-1]|uniref:glycosyltransferase n=1 Tax=Nocardioides sp. C4-1 TaxID=3151851 RepID=UPI003266BE34
MRILFTFIGGLGHLHPLLPVARAARDAGHDVAVAGHGGLAPSIEAAGFPALATGPARPSGDAGRGRDLTPLLPVSSRATEIEFAENFADRGARRHAVALQELARSWRPDVMVRDDADLGATVAAEVLGVPVASVTVLAAGTLVRPDLVVPRLDAVRAEHGLGPDPDLVALSRGLVLVPFAPSFRSPAATIVPRDEVVHFRGGARTRPRSPAGRNDRRPRVYATLGTIFNTECGDLLERLVAALGVVDADCLLTVGNQVDPDDLGPRPGHLRVERFVPQEDVLPAVDLVVSHGGSGSLMASLTQGLPSVLLPLGADQPHNAARAEELGVARVLDASSATPEVIATAVTAAVADLGLHERARQVAAEVDALPGAEAAVSAIERLVS